ncbi:MAG: hypothetical protein J6Y53_05405 [Alphaproteobacteria bacterium]|nr:hypothetical protein [Alphaproteobacteria bacterium]
MKIRCFLFLLTMFAFPAMAADDYFSIVDVDVTDVNAAVAREKAMAQANRKAVNEAAENFTDSRGMEVVYGLSGEQISYFIKEATVLEEKSSDVRYIAKLKVKVQNDILRQYLQEKGLSEYGNSNEINVIYVFDKLANWVAVEKRIKTIAAVEDVKTIAMTPNKVQFKVEYSGGLESLEQTMSAHNLALQRNDNVYILTTSLAGGE